MWWPFFAILFYAAAPIPTIISKRNWNSSQSTGCVELSIFLTTGIIISSFALPIVLARAATVSHPWKSCCCIASTFYHLYSFQIAWGACYLTICGNFVVYLAILAYFLVFDNESSGYGY